MEPENMKMRLSHMRPQEKVISRKDLAYRDEKYFLQMNIVKKLSLYTSQ